MSGWIKLHRSLKDWEWFDDHNATRLLVYLLVSVNYEDKKWKGETIKAGSMVLSFETLSKSVGMSVQKCRTSMQKLENSGEITRKVTSKYQVVSLCKWEKLQGVNEESTIIVTDEQQAINKQLTTTKEIKEIKELKNSSSPNVEQFLSWFNQAKQRYKGEIGKFRVLTKTDINNLKQLKKGYGIADFEKAFEAMCGSQWVNETNNLTPSHFLRLDNFNRYLSQTNEKPKHNPYG